MTTGTSGNAIQFDSGVKHADAGTGFAINGNVVGVGSDILQLGGTGTGSFNPGNIGTQYTGFATFNVVSGTWVATGTGSQNWTIAGGTLQLGNGGTSGAINDKIVDNGTFVIHRSDTYTFACNISGTGSLVQIGPGTTVLSGASSYTGPTNAPLPAPCRQGRRMCSRRQAALRSVLAPRSTSTASIRRSARSAVPVTSRWSRNPSTPGGNNANTAFWARFPAAAA